MTTAYLVVPCYNEEAVLPETVKRLTEKLRGLIASGRAGEDSRILLVDDGSKDRTWELIAGFHQENRLVSGLKLAHNRGHQNALLAGLILELYLCFLIPHTSFPKIMTNISGAFLMSTVCCILYRLGIGDHLDLMTIGPVFVMTPGVPITNAIRNFMENDYLSGMSRFLDALLVAGSIAIGTGASMQCWNYLIGGIL